MKSRFSIERFKEWLSEAPGHLFLMGKWRFWMPAEAIMSILITILNIRLFGSVGAIYFVVGLLLFWLGIGGLHYSDTTSMALSAVVSFMDFLIICSMGLNFVSLFYVEGHYTLLRKEEAKYEKFVEEDNKTLLALRQNDNETAVKLAAERSKQRLAAAEEARSIARGNGEIRKTVNSLVASGDRSLAAPITKKLKAQSQSPAPQHDAIKKSEDGEPFKPRTYQGESSTEFLSVWETRARLLTGLEVGMNFLNMGVIRFGTLFVNWRQKRGPRRRRGLLSWLWSLVFGDSPNSVQVNANSVSTAVSDQDRKVYPNNREVKSKQSSDEKIDCSFLGQGYFAKLDGRTKTRIWNLYRSVGTSSTLYICRLRAHDITALQAADPAWQRAELKRLVASGVKSAGAKQAAIETIEAA